MKRTNQDLWYARSGCSTAAPTAQHPAPPLPWAGGLITAPNARAAPATAFYVISVRHGKIHWGEGLFWRRGITRHRQHRPYSCSLDERRRIGKRGLRAEVPQGSSAGGSPTLLIPGSPVGMGWQEGIVTAWTCPLQRGLWTQLTWAISALMWFFVFRDGCRPSPRQQNTSSPVRSTSSGHRRIPFRINHWARLITVISHLRRTKISISCNPAHVILNPVLPHASSTFWLLS